jgi:WD40 repeat protein
VGRRIELADFDETQVLRLEEGLEREEIIGQVLLERVFYWTNGHPYLTQRLCREIVESPDIFTPQQVDALCERLFLTTDAQEQDDNLTFVRDRLLKSDADITELLTLYGQVYRGQKIRDDKANRLVTLLLLSGIVRSHDGKLQVRNRIYERVFNRAWIQKHLPSTEKRRQRAAYWRGVRRAAMLAASIGLFFIALGVASVQSWRITQILKVAAANIRTAQAQRAKVKLAAQFTYAYAIDRAQLFLQQGHTYAAVKLLKEQPEDLRGFEWRYLWQLGHGNLDAFRDHPKLILSVAVSQDGRTVALGGQDDENKTVALWDVVTRREIATRSLAGEASCVAFSPDGKILAAGGGTPFDHKKPGMVKLWDVTRSGNKVTLQERSTPQQYKGAVTSLAFSPDDRTLAVGSQYEVSLLDVISDHRTVLLRKTPDDVNGITFSPDGSTLAADGDGKVRLWNVRAKRLVRTLSIDSSNAVWSVAFSPDGKTLATGWGDDIVRLWDAHTGQLKATLPHPRAVYSIVFSPDGKTLATACWDDIVRLWDVALHRIARTLVGHVSLVNSVAFTPDGKTLISGGNDGIKLWDIDPQHVVPDAISQGSHVRPGGPGVSIALSPDGRILAAGGTDNVVRLWDTITGRSLGTLIGHKATIEQLAFSPNGRMLASSSGNDNVQLWNVATRRPAATFPVDKNTYLEVGRGGFCFNCLRSSISFGESIKGFRLGEVRTSQIGLILGNDCASGLSLIFFGFVMFLPGKPV